MRNTATHVVRDDAHKERNSSKEKGTSGLALPLCLRADNARPDALFWQERLSEKGSDPLRQDGNTNIIDSPPKGQTPFRIA